MSGVEKSCTTDASEIAFNASSVLVRRAESCDEDNAVQDWDFDGELKDGFPVGTGVLSRDGDQDSDEKCLIFGSVFGSEVEKVRTLCTSQSAKLS